MDTLLTPIMEAGQQAPTYQPADFKAPIDVRWCSGCGAYGILAQVQRILPQLETAKEKFAFISGIGCSGRFPYYMDVYGLHGIHGRALPIATGLKIARPDLSVWVATGDGDSMSIGGNHLIHAARRNPNINVLMFNNEIYSLTKGQFSPTSKRGQVTKSSPFGNLDDPFNPAQLVLGAGATFVARGVDRDGKLLKILFDRARLHPGFAFVEVYTNCVIFNNAAFADVTNKETRPDNAVLLEHGQPLVFGQNDSKGIKMDGYKPIVVDLATGNHTPDDLIVHDETNPDLARILASFTDHDHLPVPLGVLSATQRPTYDERTDALVADAQATKPNDLNALLCGDDSWQI